jgi:hypothetical protein
MASSGEYHIECVHVRDDRAADTQFVIRRMHPSRIPIDALNAIVTIDQTPAVIAE